MIYLVEDESNIRRLVVYTLQNTGFEAEGFESGAQFWAAMKKGLPDLVLLDIMLPDEDGLAILEKLRASAETAALPIMMLTAKGTEYDKVVGLDAGADDYLAKPFGMMELVARVRSLLRRAGTETPAEEFSLGALSVSAPQRRVSVEGKSVALTLKEFDLLLYLLKNTGIVLTREQILSSVWGYNFTGETRTVDVHVRTLRSKLGSCSHLVRTVRGIGYTIGEAV